MTAHHKHGAIGHDGRLHVNRPGLDYVRHALLRGALLGVHNAPAIHYSQLADRWEGIATHRRGYRHEFPHHADCSAFVTWLWWDATRAFHSPDFLNGTGWSSGHTGTLVQHGRKVLLSHLAIGDLVFYGDEGWRPQHVAIYVGHGRVVSHGSELGPFLLPVRYRPDIVWAPRRYLHLEPGLGK